jgi:hypothetical protein
MLPHWMFAYFVVALLLNALGFLLLCWCERAHAP